VLKKQLDDIDELRFIFTFPAFVAEKTAKEKGHCNYYGVNGNLKAIQDFDRYLWWTKLRMLNRRDQKGRLQYQKYQRIWDYYMENPRIKVDIWTWIPMVI
jgi:hypothetical protein